ncbi:unnamed protein product (macronuclear) [Paramecium tetraurelia]|uniref:Uncharacterized protein n=1 Tax=Paramecium tetraurelia TaxID=5888 RepID=A0D6N0_PARTE|nr:uncharacterized protein GSPATT00001738001 [Paramecium tetraurelia]CAK78697.1 unnamed protein product [Paramecium tetraurelia]|eukprot:XP_001446094.1 hypothetical protein (macronuclear) [Paramecium tetraurelia strain d4-2]
MPQLKDQKAVDEEGKFEFDTSQKKFFIFVQPETEKQDLDIRKENGQHALLVGFYQKYKKCLQN